MSITNEKWRADQESVRDKKGYIRVAVYSSQPAGTTDAAMTRAIAVLPEALHLLQELYEDGWGENSQEVIGNVLRKAGVLP